MRAIRQALTELLGVLAAGFVGFFVMLAYMAAILVWFTCGVACFCLLLVGLFSMVLWLFTRDAHAFHVMLGYFAYAGAAYAVIAAISYYRGKLGDRLYTQRVQQAAFRQIAGLRLATDANFESEAPPQRRGSYSLPES